MVNPRAYRHVDRKTQRAGAIRMIESDLVIKRLSDQLEAAERSGIPEAADIYLALARRVLELQLAEPGL